MKNKLLNLNQKYFTKVVYLYGTPPFYFEIYRCSTGICLLSIKYIVFIVIEILKYQGYLVCDDLDAFKN